VQACLQISEYGDQPPHLTEAIMTLERAHKAFKHHPAYKARTAHELALASIRMSTLCRGEEEKALHHNKARDYVEEVKRYAGRGGEKDNDSRWHANALIAESRLCRIQERYEDAQKIARNALEKSQSKDDRFTRIDARLELGQALVSCARQKQDHEQDGGEDYREAVDQFQNALADSYENPKIEAVCHLHLARCYLGLHDSNTACGHVEKWRALSPRVKNAFVQRLGKDLEKEVARLKLPFTVEWPTTASHMLDVAKEETRFRGWVTDAALSLAPHGTTDEAFKLIVKSGKSIGKATFFLWRKKAGLSKGKE
jgi:tetratricopeptide (TPR) repeat protein